MEIRKEDLKEGVKIRVKSPDDHWRGDYTIHIAADDRGDFAIMKNGKEEYLNITQVSSIKGMKSAEESNDNGNGKKRGSRGSYDKHVLNNTPFTFKVGRQVENGLCMLEEGKWVLYQNKILGDKEGKHGFKSGYVLKGSYIPRQLFHKYKLNQPVKEKKVIGSVLTPKLKLNYGTTKTVTLPHVGPYTKAQIQEILDNWVD